MAGLLNPSGPDPVAAELRRWASEPFDLALANCGLSVLAYVARATGKTVPGWLHRLGRIGAGRLMRRDTAFLSVADRALAQMGCVETDMPARGDVGMVRFAGSGLTAALCVGSLWAARGDHATVIEAGQVVKAWGVSCRQR